MVGGLFPIGGIVLFWSNPGRPRDALVRPWSKDVNGHFICVPATVLMG
jgi:hypothetical protein